MIEEVNINKAKEIYEKYLIKDFKDNEVPELKDFLKLIETNKNKVYIYKKEDIEMAYFITLEYNNFILITHLAVIKEYRGKGIGKEFLINIEKFFNDKKLIIVEVESEKMATNNEELEIIRKRQNYYLKLGFIKYDKIDYRLFGNIYDILIYHIRQKNISNEDIKDIIQRIYGEKITNKYLQINILK